MSEYCDECACEASDLRDEIQNLESEISDLKSDLSSAQDEIYSLRVDLTVASNELEDAQELAAEYSNTIQLYENLLKESGLEPFSDDVVRNSVLLCHNSEIIKSGVEFNRIHSMAEKNVAIKDALDRLLMLVKLSTPNEK